MELCLDATVFIAAMTPGETDHTACFSILQRVQEERIPLFEPAAVLDEVVEAIHQKSRADEISMSDGKHLVELLFRLPLMLQWQEGLMTLAMKTADRLSLPRISDCLYLAVAIDQKIPLITLDEEFRKKGKKIYEKIFSPGEYLRLAS